MNCGENFSKKRLARIAGGNLDHEYRSVNPWLDMRLVRAFRASAATASLVVFPVL